MIFLIVLLGAFLRFFRLIPNMVFQGELGDNYLAIKNFVGSGQIPLVGPPTSHPWLAFGPLFYWLMAPVLALFNYNPAAGAYFIAFTQVVLILINFYFIGKLFKEKVALISSLLIAASPLYLNLARQSRFYSLATIFFYPFFYYLVAGNLFVSGLSFGIMLNFHLTPIVFIPPLIIYLIRKETKAKGYLKFISGLTIPNIPFLIYNIGHRFEMLKNLILWVPYRIAGFVGIVPKNSPTSVTILNNFYSLSSFISSSFAYRPIFGALFVLVIGLYLVFEIRKNWGVKKISKEFLLVLFFLFGYLGIFIHGNPPSHYYLPLYGIPVIFFSLILAKMKSQKLIGAILIIMLLINLNFYFSKSWFYRSTAKIDDAGEVPYSLQLDVAGEIIKDAGGRSLSLKRVGQFDYFKGYYAQNYTYLLWWLGNEPQENSKISYTIYENTFWERANETKIFEKDGLTITRSSLK